MCLALLAINQHPTYPFLLLHNRDEFYARPSVALQAWPSHPAIIGGQDLIAGGSWLALHQYNKRLAFVTNVRQHPPSTGAYSRGWLVRDALSHSADLENYLADLQTQQIQYAAFNLIAGTLPDQFYYLSNPYQTTPQRLTTGLYGLSNADLDSHWPKIQRGKAALQAWLAQQCRVQPDDLLHLLTDSDLAADADLPNTGVGLANERWLSPLFVKNPTKGYGTRCSTLISVNQQKQVDFYERSYSEDGRYNDRHCALKLS